jgi:hypothetical protein
VVRERSAKPLCVGSIPTRASKSFPEISSLPRSLAPLGISAACSRFAHARKTPQVRFRPAPPCLPLRFSRSRGPSLCSGFRHAARTPRNRLKFDSDPRLQVFPCEAAYPRSTAVPARWGRYRILHTITGLYLAVMINPLAALLTISPLLSYLLVYTPLKRIIPAWQPGCWHVDSATKSASAALASRAVHASVIYPATGFWQQSSGNIGLGLLLFYAAQAMGLFLRSAELRGRQFPVREMTPASSSRVLQSVTKSEQELGENRGLGYGRSSRLETGEPAIRSTATADNLLRLLCFRPG